MFVLDCNAWPWMLLENWQVPWYDDTIMIWCWVFFHIWEGECNSIFIIIYMSWLFLPVKQEHRTAFFGEDIYIDFPPGKVGEVVFIPRINRTVDVVLLRGGEVVDPRGTINSLGHLVLEDVQEKDEGLYIIRNTSNPSAVKHLLLIVKGKMSAALQS